MLLAATRPLILLISNWCTGRSDDAYVPTLVSLNTDQLLGKLVLLQGCDEVAPELKQLAIPFMHIDDLFMPNKPAIMNRLLAPIQSAISPPGSTRSPSTSGGMTSPGSEIYSQAAGQPGSSPVTVTPGKPIDPSKVR